MTTSKHCKGCKGELGESTITETFIVQSNRDFYFCSEDCRLDYLEDRKKEEEHRLKDTTLYQKGYEEGKEEGSLITEKEKEDRWYEGYLEGLGEGIRTSHICRRCRKSSVESIHHILPRKYGGGNNIENLSLLCEKCHNFVEIKTEDLLSKGKRYSVTVLKSFIENNSFPKEV